MENAAEKNAQLFVKVVQLLRNVTKVRPMTEEEFETVLEGNIKSSNKNSKTLTHMIALSEKLCRETLKMETFFKTSMKSK